MNFDPFGKAAPDVKSEDLEVLRKVHEGWYCEYKREVSSAKDVAKSISSFANQYGGWLFYGIASNAHDHSAEAFPGIGSADWPNAQMRIRDACALNISPCPFFELFFLKGPDSGLGLPADRGVIAVRIPKGDNAPYVHSSGRIYRRLGDRSDPVPETDRSVLDLLWRRSRDARERLRNVLSETPVLSQAEDGVSFLTLFLLADPLGDKERHNALSIRDYRDIMSESDASSISLPFDNFYSSPDGFVARQIAGNNPRNLVMTFIHKRNGNSIVRIPIRTASVYEDQITNGAYRHLNRFFDQCEKFGYEDVDWVDFNLLQPLLMACFARQDALLAKGALDGSFYFKAKLHRMWRRVPFVDTDHFIELIQRDKIPLMQFEDAFAPPSDALESLLEIVPAERNIEKHKDLMSRSAIAWVALLAAVGLADLMTSGNGDSIAQLLEAGERGALAYRAR